MAAHKRLAAVIAALVVFIVSEDGGTFALAKGSPHASASGIAITYNSHFTAYFSCCGYMIEQQTPNDLSYIVVNPTTTIPKALWDVDDVRTIMASGSMEAGESFSIDVPAILDNGGHFLYVSGNAGNRGGTISLSIPELGYTYSRAVDGGGAAWCMTGPWLSLSDPRLVSIDGSNGGVGIPATYRWTVTASAKTHGAGLTAEVFYGSLSQQDSLCGGHTWSDAGLLAIVGP